MSEWAKDIAAGLGWMLFTISAPFALAAILALIARTP